VKLALPIARPTGIAPLAELARLLADARPVSIFARCGLPDEHLLPVDAERVHPIRLAPELLANPRVFDHALDYSPGEVISPNILRVRYAGYIAVDEKKRENAERFRQRFGAGAVCKLAPLGRAS
jgi:hypothetical protein